jgi:hypothetical protein
MFKPGDIFLTDSDKLGPRMVKFFMQAPTFWQWLWRKMRGTQQEVRFYHSGMVVDALQVIEQQDIVEYEEIYDAFLKKDSYIVWRKKNLSLQEADVLVQAAVDDLGQGYDLWLVIGKFLTWITGIALFVRFIQAKDKEICITRVAHWYKAIGVDFGRKTWHEITTDIVDDYCATHPNEWQQIVIKQ